MYFEKLNEFNKIKNAGGKSFYDFYIEKLKAEVNFYLDLKTAKRLKFDKNLTRN